MGKDTTLKHQLTGVRLEKIGLCRSPAVPEATHVLMKTRDGEVFSAGDPHPRIGDEQNSRDIAKSLESAVSGLVSVLSKALGLSEKNQQPAAIKETDNDMDISKATPDDIQKANPELYAAIVAKAVPSVKDKEGQKPGESVQDTVAEKEGEKNTTDPKISGKVDAAVTEKKPTVDGSSCCKAEETKVDELAAIKGAQCEMAKSIEQLQKSLGDMLGNLNAISEGRKQDEQLKKSDEPLAKAADVEKLAKSLEDLTKAQPAADLMERFVNVEKAMAKLIRESRTLAKSAEVKEPVAKTEEQPVAKSAQAGELDEESARQEPVGKSKKTVFAGTISTLLR